MNRVIRFLVPWRGRVPGEINRMLHPGVMDALVRRHVAEWVTEEKPVPPSVEPAPRREARRRA